MMINIFGRLAANGNLVNKAVILQNVNHLSGIIYRTAATQTIGHHPRNRRSNRHR